ncbi:hypothetical protein PSYMO_05595 [Pseudomonas amygdali pv. mori str. 301020]|uniref:Uncharacterized protein n=1 Tax=Pseudomonas amygdali pv. mori str. 301020 TaxID=629261 RepID=A0A656G5E4_PSEA0|nr:hypothetical protein PSYMO_05595 [Pseudomonas amygdali pv. mori str. 301020]
MPAYDGETMTNNKTNDVRVSRELMERIVKDQCVSISILDQLRALLAQPADQQGEPIALSEDVREYLQEGIENATGCEDSDVDYDFAEELAMLLGPLYRHAQPARAKVALPERMKARPFQTVDRGSPSYVSAWNACLDEVAKLNSGQT